VTSLALFLPALSVKERILFQINAWAKIDNRKSQIANYLGSTTFPINTIVPVVVSLMK
jgi:hypothetical protein